MSDVNDILTDQLQKMVDVVQNNDSFLELSMNMINNYEVIATFIELDGSYRVIRGTGNLELIPEYHHPKTNRKPNPNIIPVFDLDIGEWRSFRKNNFVSLANAEMVRKQQNDC
jgi:hypothetical protein